MRSMQTLQDGTGRQRAATLMPAPGEGRSAKLIREGKNDEMVQ